MRHRTRIDCLGAVLLLAAWLATACATNPATGRRDFVMMSEDQEIALGREYHQQILQIYRPYHDPELQAYVEKVGREVAVRGHRPELIYRFTVIDSPEVNAFALPGGYIYITRGILAYLGSEAELAAVLGHEIGHVTARHAVRQHSAQQATQLGFIFGSVLFPEIAQAGAGALYNLLGGVLLRGYGRDMELEADRFGAQYLARTGYRPEAMLGVIEVLKSQELFEIERAKEEGREPRAYHGVFATHPSNDTRLQEAIAAAREFAGEAATGQSGGGARPENRDLYLAQIDGIVFGPGAHEGVVRRNHFYHAELGIALRFPPAWRIHNQPDALVAESAVNDGAVQVALEDLNKRVSPEQFMRSRLGLEPSQGRALRAGQLEGYTALTSARTPWGRGPARVSVVYRGDRAWIFLGAAKTPEAFARYDPAFLEIASSLRSLNPEERELARGLAIRIVPAREGVRYAELAREARLTNHPEARLRLLNGHYPDGEPEAGSSIKIIE
jgi:predicted Zn-dependent protease